MGSRSSPLPVNFGPGVSPLQCHRSTNVKIFDSKYLENGDRYEAGLTEHICIGPTGSRLAPSDLTLDDTERSKIKVILFDVKYVKNGNSYDVRSNGDYIDCPLASLWTTFTGYRSRSQSLIRNVLKTVRDTRLDHGSTYT